MKKIYIKTLSLVAFAFMANVAIGQNLKVTSDGKPVENGAVIEVPYEFEDYSMPEYDLYSYNFMWDPQLYISTEEGEEDISITVTCLDETSKIELCWPGNCFTAEPGKPVSSTGTVNDTPSYISIHNKVEFDKAEEKPSASDLTTYKVTIDGDNGTVEFTVKTILADKNGVDGIADDSNAPTLYFTLEGLQVENPTKGIYVAKKGSKAKLIYKK